MSIGANIWLDPSGRLSSVRMAEMTKEVLKNMLIEGGLVCGALQIVGGVGGLRFWLCSPVDGRWWHWVILNLLALIGGSVVVSERKRKWVKNSPHPFVHSSFLGE